MVRDVKRIIELGLQTSNWGNKKFKKRKIVVTQQQLRGTDWMPDLTVLTENKKLDNTFSLDWDLEDVQQIPPYPDDGNSTAEPGIYSVEATFVSPYLKSETLMIRVIE